MKIWHAIEAKDFNIARINILTLNLLNYKVRVYIGCNININKITHVSNSLLRPISYTYSEAYTML